VPSLYTNLYSEAFLLRREVLLRRDLEREADRRFADLDRLVELRRDLDRLFERDLDRDLEALGVRLLLLVALDFFFSARRCLERRLGLFGDFALRRRRETDRLLEAFGVLLLRAERRLAFFLDGDLGALLALVGVRARFLIPMSLLRFAFISTCKLPSPRRTSGSQPFSCTEPV